MNLSFLQRITILYISDEDVQLSNSIQDSSYLFKKLIRVNSISEALVKYEENKKEIDVIISNLTHDNKLNTELLSRIREKDDAIYLVLACHHSEITNLKDKLKYLGVEYISKPIDIQYFFSRIIKEYKNKIIRNKNYIEESSLIEKLKLKNSILKEQLKSYEVQVLDCKKNNDKYNDIANNKIRRSTSILQEQHKNINKVLKDFVFTKSELDRKTKHLIISLDKIDEQYTTINNLKDILTLKEKELKKIK